MPRPDLRIGTREIEEGEMVVVVYSYPRAVVACAARSTNIPHIAPRLSDWAPNLHIQGCLSAWSDQQLSLRIRQSKPIREREPLSRGHWCCWHGAVIIWPEDTDGTRRGHLEVRKQPFWGVCRVVTGCADLLVGRYYTGAAVLVTLEVSISSE